MVEFGEQLRIAREAKGFTQQTLADKIYVTRQTISRWESGSRYPDLLTLKTISTVLEVSTDKLLSNDEAVQIVEKTPVIEKPLINNLMVVLYSLVGFLITIQVIMEMDMVPFTWDTIANGGGYVIFIAVKDVLEALLFIYGLIVIVTGRYTPKKIGIITISWFLLEAILYSRNIFIVSEVDQIVLACAVIVPYLAGVVGAFYFFFKKDAHLITRIMIAAASLYGIAREIFSLVLMNLYAESYIDHLYVIVTIMKIIIYITFIYQMYVLDLRRKRAREVADR